MPQKDGSCGPKIPRPMTECHSAISRAIQTRQTAGAPHIRKRPAILFHHCLSFHRASAIPRFGNMPGASSMIAMASFANGRMGDKGSAAVRGGASRDGLQSRKSRTGSFQHRYGASRCTAAYRATGTHKFLECARRAADFLLSDIGDDGHSRTHGPFVSPDRYKTHVIPFWRGYTRRTLQRSFGKGH